MVCTWLEPSGNRNPSTGYGPPAGPCTAFRGRSRRDYKCRRSHGWELSCCAAVYLLHANPLAACEGIDFGGERFLTAQLSFRAASQNPQSKTQRNASLCLGIPRCVHKRIVILRFLSLANSSCFLRQSNFNIFYLHGFTEKLIAFLRDYDRHWNDPVLPNIIPGRARAREETRIANLQDMLSTGRYEVSKFLTHILRPEFVEDFLQHEGYSLRILKLLRRSVFF